MPTLPLQSGQVVNIVDTQIVSIQVLVGYTIISSVLRRVDIGPTIKLPHDHCNLVPNALTIGQIHCHEDIQVCHSENWCTGDQFILHQSIILHRVISFRDHFRVLPHNVCEGIYQKSIQGKISWSCGSYVSCQVRLN